MAENSKIIKNTNDIESIYFDMHIQEIAEASIKEERLSN